MKTTTFTWFPRRKEVIRWHAREVVRDLASGPRLLRRVELSGPFFPRRALEPFMMVGDQRSRFVTISDDGTSAAGYFDTLPPTGGPIAYGYGEEITIVLHEDLDLADVELLDRTLLPPGINPK